MSKLSERELVVEWWEIWLKRRDESPRMLIPDCLPKNPLIPVHGFDSREAADAHVQERKFSYDRVLIKHVRRTRKVKQ